MKKLSFIYFYTFLALTGLWHQAGKAQNNALNFNAAGNNQVSIPHNANLNSPNAGFTVEAWIRTTQNASEATIINKYNAGGDGWMLAVNSGQLMGWHQGMPFTTSATFVNDGAWRHVAMVVNATQKILYVDGVAISTEAGSKTNPANVLSLTIGNYPSAGARYFNGDIDEVRIWNVERTPSEIANNKNIEIATNSSGLVAYYKFNQGIAGGANAGVNTLTDLTSGYNGTLSGFTLSGATSNWVSGFVPPAPPADYRTIGNVTFASPTNWEYFNGTVWVAAVSAPDASVNTITIQNGHTATANANISLDQLTVASGGILQVSTGVTLTLADGTGTDLTVNGTIDIQGIGTVSGAGSFVLATGATFSTANTTGLNAVGVTGTKTFTDGANYIFNGTTAQNTNNLATLVANNVTIDNTAGVTLSNDITITGTLTLTNGSFNITNRGVTWHTSNTPIARTSGTIQGNTSVTTSMTFGIAGFTGGNAFTIPDGTFNALVDVGNLTINRTNQLNFSNDQLRIRGTLTLTLGFFNVPSNYLIFAGNSATPIARNGTTQVGTLNTTQLLWQSTGVAFTIPNNVFSGTQTYSFLQLANTNDLTLNNQTIISNSNTQIQGAGRIVGGTGLLNISSGTLTTGKELGNGAGLAFNNMTSGVNLTLNATTYNYTKSTSGNINTGTLLPATIQNITINHSGTTPNSVVLSQNTTITGFLNLQAGVFDISSRTVTWHTGNTPIVRTSGTLMSNTTTNWNFGAVGFTGGNAFTLPTGVFAGSFDANANNFTVNRTNSLTWTGSFMFVYGNFNFVLGEVAFPTTLLRFVGNPNTITRTSGTLTLGASSSFSFEQTGMLTLPNDLFTTSPMSCNELYVRGGGGTLNNQNLVISNLYFDSGIAQLVKGTGNITVNNNFSMNRAFQNGTPSTSILSGFTGVGTDILLGSNLLLAISTTTSGAINTGTLFPSTVYNFTIYHTGSPNNQIVLTNNLTITNTLRLLGGELIASGKTLTFQTGNTPITRNGTTEIGTIATDATTNLVFGTAGNTAGSVFVFPNSCFTANPTINNFTINRTNAIGWNNQNLTVNGTFTLSNAGNVAFNTGILAYAPTGTTLLYNNSTVSNYSYTMSGEFPATNPPQNVTINLTGTGSQMIAFPSGSARTITGILTVGLGDNFVFQPSSVSLTAGSIANNGAINNCFGATISPAYASWSPQGIYISPSTASIQVTGSSNAISNGSTTPSATNLTLFPTTVVSGSYENFYLVENNTSNTFTSIVASITGTDASSFSVSLAPATPMGAANANFMGITFAPTTTGIKNAMVNINYNSPCGAVTYTFAIQGLADVANKALAFNGTLETGFPYVQITNSPLLDVSNNFTVEAWVKPFSRAQPCINTIVGKKANGGSNPGWALFINSYNWGPEDRRIIFETQGAECKTAVNVATLNTWQHIAVSVTNGVPVLYVNGSVVGWESATFNPTVSTQNLQIGALGNASFPFNGELDEVRIWTIGRTTSEISSNQFVELAGNEAGLVAYCKFNEGISGADNTTLTTVSSGTSCVASGSLNGFALTSTAANFVAGQASITQTADNGLRGEINLQGNAQNIVNNDLTPITTDHTDFGTVMIGNNLAHTYTIANEGANPLQVTQVSLSGANAGEFAISGLPTLPFNIAASGSQTFNVTLTPSSIGTKNATVTILNNDCDEASYDFAIQGLADVANKALSFDGSNDVINTGYTVPATNNITLEVWVRPASAPINSGNTLNNNPVICSDRISFNWNHDNPSYIGSANIQVAGSLFPVVSFGTLNANTWYHLAATYDGSNLRSYVNGVLVNTTPATGNLAGVTNPMTLGRHFFHTGSINHWAGNLDEVRMWSTARTQAEISANMNTELAGNEAGLMLYYKFNQGVAEANNTAITQVTNASTCSGVGNFSGFALTGTTSNFVAGQASISQTADNGLRGEINLQGNAQNIVNNDLTPITTDHTDFGTVAIANSLTRNFTITNAGANVLQITDITLTGANASEFSITTLPAFPITINPSNGQLLQITLTPTSGGTKTATITITNNDCDESTFTFNIGATVPSRNGLAFDGADDKINLGVSAPAIERNQPFTIETYFRTAGTGTMRVIEKVSGGTGYFLNVEAGKIQLRLVNVLASNDLSVETQSTYNNNVWRHLAVTYDASSNANGVKIYIDGVSQPLTILYNNLTANINTGGTTFIGTTATSAFDYQGELDEFRMWNVARSCDQINQTKDRILVGNEAGLRAYYPLNQNSAGGNNVGLTTVIDSQTNAVANNGLLQSFTLTGTASNWIDASANGLTENTTPVLLPNIALSSGGNNISSGSTTFLTTNGTDFGGVTIGNTQAITYTISNASSSLLEGISVSILGANASQFTLITPPPTTVGAFSSETFQINFTPNSTGTKIAQISIASTANCSNPYTFQIQGVAGLGSLTANSATGILVDAFQANWILFPIADNYRLDVATDANFTNILPDYTNLPVGNVNTYSVAPITPLSPATLYYYRVRAENTGNIITNYSNTIALRTLLATPNPPSVGNNTTTSFQVNWEAVPVSGYYVYVSTEAGVDFEANLLPTYNPITVAGGSASNVNITGLESNKKYFVRIKTYLTPPLESTTTSPYSPEVETVTLPLAPVATAPSLVTNNAFQANWNGVSGNGNGVTYDIDIALGNSFLPSQGTYTYLIDTYQEILSLLPANAYYYRVRANNGAGASANSNSITVLTAPNALPATVITPYSFQANWGAGVGITGFEVQASLANDFSSGTQTQTVVGAGNTNFVFTGLSPANTYYFRVRTYMGTAYSPYSNVESLTTLDAPPTAPVAVSPTLVTDNSATANWQEVAGITDYRIDVASDALFNTLIANNITVTGTGAGGANLSYSISGLNALTAYYYRVRAVNGQSTLSANSNAISFSTLPTSPAVPTSFAITNVTENSAFLSWNTVIGATGYYLDLATDAGFTTYLASYNPKDIGLNTSFVVNSLPANSVFYARLRAYTGISPNIVQSANTATLVITTLPTAPIAIAGSNFTNSSFDANWNAIVGTAPVTYTVQRSEDNFTSISQTISSITSTSQNFAGLLGGANYYYRVSVTNANGTSTYSNIVQVLTLPDVITANAATTVTSSSFVANWQASSAPAPITYTLDYTTDNTFATGVVSLIGFAPASTNFNIGGLLASTTYYYRLTVVNATGSSNVSNVITVTTGSVPPPVPTALGANPINNNNFTANWTASTGATSYKLDVSTKNDFSTFISGYTDLDVSNVLAYSVTGLVGNIKYYYRVRAVQGAGTSASSNVVNVLTLPNAGETQAVSSVTTNSFKAHWKPDPNASSNPVTYEVQWSNDGFATFGSQAGLTDLNYQVTSGLIENEQYAYRVRITNATGAGAFSTPSTAFRLLCPAPTALPATLVENTTFTANWSAINNVSTYYLDISTSNTFATFVAGYNNLNVSNVTTWNITGLTPNTTYYYRVRAENASANVSANSNTITAQTLLAPVALATTPITNITTNSFRVNWNIQSGITGYYVYVATDNTDLTSFEASLVPSYNPLTVAGQSIAFADISGLQSNTNYYVRVKTYSGVLVSSYSLPASTITFPAAPVAIQPNTVFATDFQAVWNAVSGNGAVTYDLQSSAGNQTGISNLFFNYAGLTEGTAYIYRVRASNASGQSLPSNEITVITTLTANPATLPTLNGFTANWNTGIGVDGYEVQVSLNAGFSPMLLTQNIIGVANNSFVFNTLSPSTTYYYRVRAYKGTSYSPVSNPISVNTLLAPLPAPVATSATLITDLTATANWNVVVGASSYTLETSTNNFASILNTFTGLTTNSQALTGLNALTNYQYRVRAINIDGIASANSNVIDFTTLPTPPATPTGFVLTSVGSNNATLSWNVVVGASGYYLDLATDAGFTTFIPSYNPMNVGLNTNFIINSLASNSVYYVRLRAYSGTSPNIVQSLNTPTVVITTLPTIPTATAPTAITATGFEANWSAPIGNATVTYNVQASTDNFATVSQTITNVTASPYTFSALAGGTYYYYRISSSNASGTSAYSNIVPVLTLPTAVTANPATTVTSSSFVANWTTGASAGGFTYTLEYSTDNTFATGVTTLSSLNLNSQNITGLAQNTTYHYRVRVFNATGASAVSNVISVTTGTFIAAPVASTATAIGSTGFTANWGTVATATSYRVDISTMADFSNFVLNDVDAGNALAYNATGLAGNTTYYYRVRAINGVAVSANSNTITVLSLPTAVIANVPTAVTTNSFTANWATFTGNNPSATYTLEVATDAGFTAIMNTQASLTANSATLSGLITNTLYYYRVRVVNASGSSVVSNVVSLQLLSESPTALTATLIENSSFTANWSAVNNASTYYLDLSTSNTFATFVAGYNNLNVSNVTSLNITGLTANTQYYYRVRAENASLHISANSNVVQARTLLVPVTLASTPITNITTSGFRVNWVAQAGVGGYYVYVSASNTDVADFELNVLPTYAPMTVSGGTSTFANITNLQSNTQYFVRVRSYAGALIASYSLPASTATLPTAPTAGQASAVSANSFTANWDLVTGNSAEAYTVEISNNASFAPILDTQASLATNNATFAGLTAGTVYYYRVRAINASGTSTNSSAIAVITTPIANPATAIVSNGFTANWNIVSNTANYVVELATIADFSTISQVQNITGDVNNSLIFNTLNAGTTYFYRIRAQVGSTASPNSNVISVTTLLVPPTAPVATAPTTVTHNAATANWQEVASITTYRIDVATDVNFNTLLVNNQLVTGTGVAGANLSYALTSLNQLSVYFYRVRAVNAQNTASFNSNVITFTTLPTPPASPTGLAITSITTNSLQISWNSVIGVNGYYVDLATDAGFTNFVSPYNPVDVGLNTSLTINNLPLNTLFFARVRSYAGAGATLTSSANTAPLTINTLPTIPTAISATSVANTSFTANWNAITGTALGIRYNVQASTEPTFTTGVIAQNDLTTTTANFTGLNVGTVYYYRVFGNNDSNLPSLPSNTITVVTTPIALPADNIVSNSFRANWQIVTGASEYVVEVSLLNTFATLVTSQNIAGGGNNNFTFTGLTNNTPYFYRVYAKAGSVTSPASSTIALTTLLTSPEPPIATAATSITTTSFTANWNVVAGTSITYTVELSNNNFTTILSTQSGITGLSANFTGLTPNQNYTYRVRAIDGAIVSLNSNLINVVTLALPTTANSATAISTTGFTANWASATGTNLAYTYTVEVATDNAFANIVATQASIANTLNSFAFTGLVYNTVYYYRVLVINASGNSASSNVVTLQLNSIAPVATLPTNILDVTMTANWDLVTGATSYRFDLSTNPAFSTFVAGYNNINVGDVATLNLSTLIANTVYYYRVRAVNDAGNISPNSNTISQRTLLVAPTSVTIDQITASSLRVNWQEVAGVGGYNVYISTATGVDFENALIQGYNPLVITGSGIAGNPMNTTFTGLSGNSVYYVRLKSYIAPPASPVLLSDYTVEQAPLTRPTAPIATSPNADTDVNATNFTATWQSISGNGTTPVTYNITVASDLAFGNIVATQNAVGVTTISQVMSGLTAGTVYYYRITATNATGVSGTSNTINVITQPIANPATAIGVASFTANWNVVNTASGYIVQLSADNFATTPLLTQNLSGTGNNSYTFTGLGANIAYQYRVRAVLNTTQSPQSPIVSLTTLFAPPNAPLATAPTNILFQTVTSDYSGNANWDAVAGITAYRLDVSTDVNFNVFSGSGTYQNVLVNGTTFALTGLIPSTNYYYRVRAVNTQGTPSANSNIINLTVPITPPPAPANFMASVTSNTNTTLSFNWDVVFGADGYNLDLSTVNTFATLINTYNPRDVGAGNSFIANNLLSPNTNYFARIRSRIGTVNSESTPTVATSTLAPAPSANLPTAVDVTTFTANWNLITGIGNATVTYRVEVSESSTFATPLANYDNLTTNSQVFTATDGIQAGKVYYYRVFSRNLGGVSLVPSATTIVITKPQILPATDITSVGFKANWDVVTGATNYTVEVSTNPAFSPITLSQGVVGANNQYAFNILTPGTTYYYRIKALIGSITSPYSNTETLTTIIATQPPLAPVAFAGSLPTTTSFRANWSLINNADTYRLDVSSNSTFTPPLFLDNFNVGNVTSFDVSGVASSTTYYYRVRAVNTIATSPTSNEVAILTLTAPAGTPTAPSNPALLVMGINSIEFSWKDNASNETGFEIQRGSGILDPLPA